MRIIAKKFYITTAIDYVNGKPHVGHAFEKVIADALARQKRLQGKDVWFLTGTDENAQKNATVAKEQGREVKEFVDSNSLVFIEFCKALNISYDRFIRTTEEEHTQKAQEIFRQVYEKGEIYLGKYEGLYCSGCEAFITEKELVEGECPEHKQKPEQISEDAYFFKMSKYESQVKEFVSNYIAPESRKKEILSRIKHEGIRDLCVSRKNLDWGIDNPIDDSYKIYVWFDALINYVSGASGNWPADVHVVGKGINWFHSIIWPSILMATNLDLPKKLLVHGYLNLGGEKIGKSTGNIIDPLELAKKYGVDALRYGLLRCSTFEDSEFSEDLLIERYNNELANKLGNLVSRVSALAEKYGVQEGNRLIEKLDEKEIEDCFDSFELDKALNKIFRFVDLCNEYIQEKKPWETKDTKILGEITVALRRIARLLEPFIPESAQKIAEVFGSNEIKKSPVIFKKIEAKE